MAPRIDYQDAIAASTLPAKMEAAKVQAQADKDMAEAMAAVAKALATAVKGIKIDPKQFAEGVQTLAMALMATRMVNNDLK